MRIFVALDIDDAIRERLVRFLDGVRGFASEARWVRPESLHITLKFIGEKTPEAVEAIQQGLITVPGKGMEIALGGYGFFPTAKRARVFWAGITSGPELGRLAASVDDALGALGVKKEDHAFSPHLTLARAGKSPAPGGDKDDRPKATFGRLEQKLTSMARPDFGTMTARQFFLYQSELSPGGSKYTKLAGFPLL